MKTTQLPSVETAVDYAYSDGIYSAEGILTQRDTQAYTSLVEGIKGMIKHDIEIPRPEYYFNRGEIGVYEHQQALNHWMEQEARNQALTDILENVVKPLYGKE